MGLFVLEVAYSQISVFQSCLKTPFNDWTEKHVAQGFSWRPGSVSFRTLDEEGPISVSIETGTSLELSPSTIRAIQVPFHVKPDGGIEVATIDGTVEKAVDPGDYTLLFEHGRRSNTRMWCRFRFVRETSIPRVVRADDDLQPGEPLLMEARPAAP